MEYCAFSETQFAFCFTFEYIKHFFPFVPLPIFPNTVNEGREGGGYDVMINGSLFFQFKIPKYYDKRGPGNKKYWDVFKGAYYKIALDTNGEQFRLLKALQDPSRRIQYATPTFHTPDDLSNYYAYDGIVANSALFSVDLLPAFGSGHHNLIYHPGYSWGQLFSDPVEVRREASLNPNDIFPQGKFEGKTIAAEAVQIVSILRENEFSIFGDLPFNTNNPSLFVKQVYTALLTNYNVHWYPVISRRRNNR